MQERKHLAMTLRDTKTVIAKLERLLGAIIHVVFVFSYLYIFNVRRAPPPPCQPAPTPASQPAGILRALSSV